MCKLKSFRCALVAVIVCLLINLGECRGKDPDNSDSLPNGALRQFGSPNLHHALAISPQIGFDDVGNIISADASSVSVWRPTDGKELHRFRLESKVIEGIGGCIPSKDGKFIYLLSRGHLYAKSATDFAPVAAWECNVDTSHDWPVDIIPDQKQIMLVDRHNNLRFFSLPNSGPIEVKPVRLKIEGRVSLVAISPDGRTAALGTPDAVYLLGLPAGEVRRSFDLTSTGVSALLFKDNKQLCVGGLKSISVIDVEKDEPILSVSTGHETLAIARSADGKHFAFGCANEIQVREAETWKLERRIPWITIIKTLAFSPNGELIVAGGNNGAIGLWDFPTGEPRFQDSNLPNAVRSLSFTSDIKNLLASGGDEMREWNIDSGKLVGNKQVSRAGRNLWCQCLNKRQEVLTASNRIGLWELEDFRLRDELYQHANRISAFALAVDENTYAIGDERGGVQVRRVEDKEYVKVLEGQEGRQITSVQFSADGKSLTSLSSRGDLVVWHIDSAKRVDQTKAKYKLGCVGYGPAASIYGFGLAAKEPRLLNVSTGQEYERIQAEHGPVGMIAFSNSGRFLAAGTANGCVELWDFEKQQRVRVFSGHRGPITALRFSPDGSLLASGGSDRVVVVWKIP